MRIAEILIAELDAEAKYPRKHLERLPMDKLDFKADEKSMTLGWLATFLLIIPTWDAFTLTTDQFDATQAPSDRKIARTNDELTSMFDANIAKVREALTGMSDVPSPATKPCSGSRATSSSKRTSRGGRAGWDVRGGRIFAVSEMQNIVHSDPEIMSGTPVFVGTRVPAYNLFDDLETGHSLDKFLASCPSVTREQAVAALELAKEAVAEVASG